MTIQSNKNFSPTAKCLFGNHTQCCSRFIPGCDLRNLAGVHSGGALGNITDAGD